MRPRRSENAQGRNEKVTTTRDGEFASLLAIILKVIMGHDPICEGEKTPRERKCTIRETEGQTTARLLGWSSIGRARVARTPTRRGRRGR